ncbi:MAG TPA: cytochrome c3 family protein [Pseudolabrys sp.]|nr:cytochrome c3 family protein [Pseudolabrys sp.]
MPQIFRPSANTIARIILVALLVVPFLCIGLAYAVMRSPYTTGQDVTMRQPVPFSHEHHVGELGIDCRYCHTSVEKSAFAGLPPTKTCMTCHSQIFTNAAMLAPVRESLAEHKPIHWQRVHLLPGYVYFDHSIHIAKGVGCTTCHGAVDTMPLIKQTAPLTMGWCLDCHRNPAPHLRPPSEIFSTSWKPPADQFEQSRKLMAQYLIHTEHLTDCSVCHR